MTGRNRLVVVGAGGFGREVASWLSTSPILMEQHSIGDVVFLDDNPDPRFGLPVLSALKDYRPHDTDIVICAIGKPAVRELISKELASRGAYMPAFVHDSAIVGDRVKLGAGTVVCPHVTLTADINIGEGVQINVGTTVGHDVQIGEYVTISPQCVLTGGVHVGAKTFFGTGALVAPRKTIGANSTIGIGSTVLRRVSDNKTVFGTPAREVGGSR